MPEGPVPGEGRWERGPSKTETERERAWGALGAVLPSEPTAAPAKAKLLSPSTGARLPDPTSVPRAAVSVGPVLPPGWAPGEGGALGGGQASGVHRLLRATATHSFVLWEV